MVAKKESEAKKPEAESKKSGKKKKHLHQIITTRAHDGSFGHEHIYKDKKEDMHSHPPVFAGTSSNMEDLHQHMDDHFGGGDNEQAEEQGEGEQPGAGGGEEEPQQA